MSPFFHSMSCTRNWGHTCPPSLHLRPEIAPPLICSDLEYSFIVAQRQAGVNLRTCQENERLNLPDRL